MRDSIVCCKKRLGIDIQEYDNKGLKVNVRDSGGGARDSFLEILNKALPRVAKVAVENVAEMMANDYNEKLPTEYISYSYSITQIEDKNAIVSIKYSQKYSEIISGYFRGKKGKAERHRDYVTDELEEKVESTIDMLKQKADKYVKLGIYTEVPEVVRHNKYELSAKILSAGTVKDIENRLEAFINETMRNILFFEDGLCFFYGRTVFMVENGKIKRNDLYKFAKSQGYRLYARYRSKESFEIKITEVIDGQFEDGIRKVTYYLSKSSLDTTSGNIIEDMEIISSSRVYFDGSTFVPNYLINSYITSKLHSGDTEEELLKLVIAEIQEEKDRLEIKGKCRKKFGIGKVNLSNELVSKLVKRVLGVKVLSDADKEFAEMIMEQPRIRPIIHENGDTHIRITFILRRYWYSIDELTLQIKNHKEYFDKCVAFAILTQPICKEIGTISDFSISSKLVGGNKLVYELHKRAAEE